jgi:hypothetical protein
LFASTCVVAIGAVNASVAHGQTPPCKEAEKTQPASEDANNLIELQPNSLRPTFDVALDYHTDGEDDISFPPKAGKRPGSEADVAAEFTDPPRYKGHGLKGDRFIAAHASKSGRRIVLYVCFDKIPQYAAGRYEGTIDIFGPKLADFTYAIVVTTKWPRWTAWAAILVTIVVSLIVAIVRGILDGPSNRRDWKGWLRLPVAVGLALILGLLPYWSVYGSNETWGSTPPSDLTALVTATFAAVVGGFVTANRLFSS